jgi:superoxide dismutase
MERAWICFEVASRMASKLKMVRLLDKHKKASAWYLENKHLSIDSPPDFFNLMKSWDPKDKPRIQGEIRSVFGSAAEFNKGVLRAFLAMGGTQLIETRAAKADHEVRVLLSVQHFP